MSRKSLKDKVAERFKQIQADRKHEETSYRFDERRDMLAEAIEDNHTRHREEKTQEER
jgi:hypothetical protein